MLFRLVGILPLLYFKAVHVASEPQDVRLVLHGVQRGCSQLRFATDWSALGPLGSRDIPQLKAACYWIENFQAGADIGADVPLQHELRHLKDDPDVLWFGDSTEGHYPWILYLLVSLICLIVIFFWEQLWLRSTIFIIKCIKASVNLSLPPHKHVSIGSISLDISKFWKIAEEMCKSIPSQVPQGQSMLRFTSRVFYGHVKAGNATIEVERTGPCDGEVRVQVRTDNREQQYFAAKAGVDYEETSKELVFPHGVRKASMDVALYGKFCWQPMQWFQVHLGPVTAGDAQLQPQKHTRCFVVDDRNYPGHIPDSVLEDQFLGIRRFKIAYYFMQECVGFRGIKFWKTLVAMMYPPVHDVVVQYMVQKLIITYAVNKDFYSSTYSGAMTEIVILAAIHFFSVCIYRWSVVVQTKNRGRTGGVRQTHRLHLLDKMLMIDHKQQMQSKGESWLYAAIHDVDRITVDVYWNFFSAVQALESMILSFLLIIFWDFYKIDRKGGTYDINKLLPSISFVVVCPLTTFMIWRRRHAVVQGVQARKDQEAEWMNIFSWLAEVGNFMYGFGYRELAKIEEKFKTDNKTFVSVHQKQRDIMSDSVAIAMWISTVAYLLILIWGGFGLLAETDGDSGQQAIDSGQYVLLLGLFSKFGKYIIKLHNCIVNFERGSVSLERVIELLNMPDDAKLKVGQTQEIPEDCILLRSACLDLKSKTFGIGPFGAVRTEHGSEIRFPLGKIVCVKSVHESRLLGIFAMVAGVVQPTSGNVFCPQYLQRVMLPTQPVHSIGELTSLEELLETGVTPRQGACLLKCLDIDPDQGARHLSPGQIQLLVLLRALLRDPEVLVLASPVAFVGPHKSKNAMTLLRVWQAYGGANGLLRLCEQVKIKKEGEDVWIDTQGASFGVEEEDVGERTVIVSFSDVDLRSSADVIIDLDRFWEDEGEKALNAPVALPVGPSPRSIPPEAHVIPNTSPRYWQPGKASRAC